MAANTLIKPLDHEESLNIIRRMIGGSGPATVLQARPFAFTNVLNGEIAGSSVPIRLPDVGAKMANIGAVLGNAGRVYLGGATLITGAATAPVTVADGTTDITTGWQLGPGQETGWIGITNLNIFDRICDNDGDDLTYVIFK